MVFGETIYHPEIMPLAHSTDLNIIENVWAEEKKTVKENNAQIPTSADNKVSPLGDCRESLESCIFQS